MPRCWELSILCASLDKVCLRRSSGRVTVCRLLFAVASPSNTLTLLPGESDVVRANSHGSRLLHPNKLSPTDASDDVTPRSHTAPRRRAPPSHVRNGEFRRRLPLKYGCMDSSILVEVLLRLLRSMEAGLLLLLLPKRKAKDVYFGGKEEGWRTTGEGVGPWCSHSQRRRWGWINPNL